MTSYVTPKKNSAFIFYVGLPSVASADIFQVNPTLAAGDVKVSIDGGAFANLTTLPTVTPSGGRSVKASLSSSEMNGDNIVVVFSDAAGGEWKDVLCNIQTSARQIDDLAYPATSGRSMVVDASGLVDSNTVKIGPTGSGTAQTARDVGASVLLSSGTGTGQLDFTSGVVKANATQILGTAVSTPATAGILDVNVKNMNNVAGTAITTIKAVQGLTTADTISTCTTVTNQLTAAAIASGVWKDTTASDFTTALSVGKSLMNGVALGTGLTINGYTGDTPQTGDSYARIGAAGAGLTNIGTIATCTNLTNAPTAGDFTAAMKTSLSAATPTVLLTAGTGSGQVTLSSGVLTANANGDFTATQKTSLNAATPASVTGNVGGNVVGSVGSVASQVSANVTAVNGHAVTGDGHSGTEWGPA